MPHAIESRKRPCAARVLELLSCPAPLCSHFCSALLVRAASEGTPHTPVHTAHRGRCRLAALALCTHQGLHAPGLLCPPTCVQMCAQPTPMPTHVTCTPCFCVCTLPDHPPPWHQLVVKPGCLHMWAAKSLCACLQSQTLYRAPLMTSDMAPLLPAREARPAGAAHSSLGLYPAQLLAMSSSTLGLHFFGVPSLVRPRTAQTQHRKNPHPSCLYQWRNWGPGHHDK